MKRLLLAALGLVFAGSACAQIVPQGNGGYPAGAVPVAISAAATTGGIATGLPAAAGKFTWLCGISVSAGSATTAITVAVAITNTAFTGNQWYLGAPVTAVGTTGPNLIVNFNSCIPGTAINTGQGMTVGALGTGGINQTAMMWGYQR